MTISVVIPYVHDCEALVQLTRDALYSIRGEYQELVLVDDASGITGHEFKSQADTYIANFERQGYIKSANKGIAAARGDYICLVCNDTRLTAGTLSDLCGEGYIFPKIDGKEIPFWDGAFYCFPRSLGGLYDEHFHTYFGDLDKFLTAKQTGIPLERRDAVQVWHKQSATTKHLGIRKKQYHADHQTFMNKWGFDPLENYYSLI